MLSTTPIMEQEEAAPDGKADPLSTSLSALSATSMIGTYNVPFQEY